jgi:hypothetical protein
MFLTIPKDTDFTDTLDDVPFVFEAGTTESSLDADDPESWLADYFSKVGTR